MVVWKCLIRELEGARNSAAAATDASRYGSARVDTARNGDIEGKSLQRVMYIYSASANADRDGSMR